MTISSPAAPGPSILSPAATDLTGASCPLPLAETEKVMLGHGSGGQLSAELLHDVLLPALGAAAPAGVPEDAAVLDIDGTTVVLSTDSFVVSPLFFPGGDIGSLAVHGTVNDLAMMGASPLALAVAYVIEEGFPLEDLRRVTASVGAAAAAVGVPVVTGDTKVVGRGGADGIFVTTTGIGRRLPGARVSAGSARPGDVIVLSGPLGAHGTAILSARESLGFDSAITSDTRPLHRLVAAMVVGGGAGLRAMRDPTRGGVASALNEIAAASGAGIEIEEQAVPIPAAVAAACEVLGLDPLHVANEGCLVAVLAPEAADAVLAAMRALPEGRHAARLGTVVAAHPGRVVMRTLLGGTRIVDMLVGEQLPRIC
nr:hydrogenase expression/formation protein HypE [Frankia sp. CiP3]